MNCILVNKDEDISNIDNNVFVYCIELRKGLLKKDLEPLGLSNNTFENVSNTISNLELINLNNNGFDCITFGENLSEYQGQIIISEKRKKDLANIIDNLPLENKNGDFVNSFLNSEKLNSRYFDNEFITEMVDSMLVYSRDYQIDNIPLSDVGQFMWNACNNSPQAYGTTYTYVKKGQNVTYNLNGIRGKFWFGVHKDFYLTVYSGGGSKAINSGSIITNVIISIDNTESNTNIKIESVTDGLLRDGLVAGNTFTIPGNNFSLYLRVGPNVDSSISLTDPFTKEGYEPLERVIKAYIYDNQ